MKKLIAVIALASSMGVVSAEPVSLTKAEPMLLTEVQMDKVNAGGFAFSDAFANALGVLGASSRTETRTLVEVMGAFPTQGGQITMDRAQSWSLSEASAL